MKPLSARAVPVLLTLLALLLAAALPGFSLSITEIDGSASVAFIGSNPQTVTTGLDPVMAVAPLLGASVPMRLGGPFFFEPGLEFLGTFYDWSGSKAQLTQAENAAGFFTMAVILSAQAGVIFPISSTLSLGGTLGLDFFLRFPLELQNTGAAVKSDESSALGWFYGSGRFFYPESRLFLRWRISDPVDLVFNVRAFYPVYHFWDGSGEPFWDALVISGGVGLGVRLDKLFK